MDQEYKDRAKVDTHKLWDQHIIPNWNIATRKSETRELWWQGIAPRCRGTAWQLAFGNSLAVSPETFRLALNRAREVENGLKKSPTMYSFKERDLFGAIRRDVGKTFPELKIFQVRLLFLLLLLQIPRMVLVDGSASGNGAASPESVGSTYGVLHVP